MGYFRFFYYIAYIFNTIMRIFKRYGKQILWITAIFVFLCICMYNPKSSAYYQGNFVYSDPNNTIYQAYDSICIEFIRRFDLAEKVGNNTTKQRCSWFRTQLVDLTRDVYLFYTTSYTNDGGEAMLNGAPLQTRYIYALTYEPNNSTFASRPSAYDNYLGIPCDIIDFYRSASGESSGLLSCMYYYRMDADPITFTAETITQNSTFYIPTNLLHYNNQYIYEYFYNNKSLEEIELLYEMNSKLDSIEDTMTELPTENSISSDELPTDSGVDTSDLDTGLNGLFGQIAEAFTDIPRSKYNITVPVPFTDKSFVIPYNLTSSALSDSNFSWVTSIISAFWYYVVGRYILIDIINKFEHIQSGNIENMENDNIKEDLL